jgi:hypothetical protein
MSYTVIYLFFFSTDGSNQWISPGRYLKGQNNDQMQITFNPADMNSAGIIYFRDPNATANSYLMSFVASKIRVQWVSGPKNLFFDFVGKILVCFDPLRAHRYEAIYTALQRQYTEKFKKTIFPDMKLHGLCPNSFIHVL